MANVLTTAGSVACQHQGAVAAPAGAAKLTVGGKPVLLVDQVSAWTITGCTQTGPGMTPYS